MIDQWLTDNDIRLDWYNGDVLLDESEEGTQLAYLDTEVKEYLNW